MPDTVTCSHILLMYEGSMRSSSDRSKDDAKSQIEDIIIGVGGKKGIQFSEAEAVAGRISDMFEAGEFDVCSIVFNRFQSAMTQIVTRLQLIPFAGSVSQDNDEPEAKPDTVAKAAYIFDPTQVGISMKQPAANLFSTHPPVEQRLQALGFDERK